MRALIVDDSAVMRKVIERALGQAGLELTEVLQASNGEEALPVLWEDNYISLMPGETRELTATYRASELGGAKPSVEVSGWNVTSQ